MVSERRNLLPNAPNHHHPISLSAPAKKVKVKSEELKKKIRKKVMAKIGKAKKIKNLKG